MIRSTMLKAAAVGVAAILSLTACGAGSESAADTIKVGALAVPAGDMLKYVSKELAPKDGLSVDYKEFSDYNTPNAALSDGDIDANLFQNTTFMETYNKASGKDLVSVGKVYLPPMALYSNDIATLSELPDGASIAVPNDPTNEGRALLLLASKGLIEVKENPITLKDITANPKNFKFTEIENASLPQALNDKDAAIVTLAFALPAGLSADKQLLVEGEDSAFYNVLAVKAEMKDDPRVQKLFTMLTSQDMRDFLKTEFKGLVIPAS
ncbi:MetQ/NlpA family ABC transporter substrate-binding protein [Arthrobacter psychrochitiniphilus]|uniref:Lipoprotein n=1 Tax=Arthrobacter psychrochitiniphilus TaxID=291045 RepID=A0A2V3DNG2_9MICC|nr:MetQ/NlpA family ABC transporter substrate-binding protein [Arthrobacter psychrochitiniphilus]NYG18458.1 D-methionine transport system substrate-binding protein [Arthrobacter psychrochitiniphilus]PXA64513.1 NLPA lipoprotein [Arthrobacter psychrochitiniphilus]